MENGSEMGPSPDKSSSRNVGIGDFPVTDNPVSQDYAKATHVQHSGNAGPATPAKLDHPRLHSRRHRRRSRSGLPFPSIRLSRFSLGAIVAFPRTRVGFVDFLASGLGTAFLEEG